MSTPYARGDEMRTVDDDRIELAAQWLHSWAGQAMEHPWEKVGPTRKARLRAQALGVANILHHGTPENAELPQ